MSAVVVSLPAKGFRHSVDAVRKAVRERAQQLNCSKSLADSAVSVALSAILRERRSPAMAYHLACQSLRRATTTAPVFGGAA